MNNVEDMIEMYASSPMKPRREICGYKVCPGLFYYNGAVPMSYGVNFTITTHYGTGVELLLFHRNEDKPYAVLPFPKNYCIGDVYSMMVFGLEIDDLEYAYRVDGPYRPEEGHLFDRKNILLDPYARSVAGCEEWGKKTRDFYTARVISNTFDWGDSFQSSKEISDLVIYELHVRNFTRNDNSGVTNKGTYDGLREKIPYLKKLGVNAVELMPIFEFDETLNRREYEGRELLESWGYNTVAFFAPNASYSASTEGNTPGMELKKLIKELHDNDMEVILDVVFNHTAEGNEAGRTFSFKGLDNKIYYMLTPEGTYYNFSGCGNTLNCNHPVVSQMIQECLRYWAGTYRVDGFRFDLATILGRDRNGYTMKNPPLLEALARDPLLAHVKLIAEAWDAGGGYQVGSFPASYRWAEWNGRYRDSLRGYLKGDLWESKTAAWSIAGSGDMYGEALDEAKNNYVAYHSSVNFLTCHDGFTLYDLYTYNEKHNLLNGWNNTDGTNDNRSWNCGYEGETQEASINSLRRRMIRNACAILMCSRGTPMLLSGDEFGNTQFGNNNCYCQDNEMSWLDWSLLEKNEDIFEFFQYMIAFRKKHTIIRKHLPDAMNGFPAISLHGADGNYSLEPENSPVIGVCFAGYDRRIGRDDLVYVAVNVHWEDEVITLPQLNRRGYWYLYVNTCGDGNGQYTYAENEAVRIDSTFNMRPRSVAVFATRPY